MAYGRAPPYLQDDFNTAQGPLFLAGITTAGDGYISGVVVARGRAAVGHDETLRHRCLEAAG